MVFSSQGTAAAWLAVLSLSIAFCSQAAERRPNVVVIVTDDLGYGDADLFGQHPMHDTPSIKLLAREGMLFSNAIATPLCSPTRYALMTGMHPARGGWLGATGHDMESRLTATYDAETSPWRPMVYPRSATRLRYAEFTLAELLRSHDYVTGHFGKWHLGRAPHQAKNSGFSVEFPQSVTAGPPSGYYGWKTGAYADDRSTEEDDHIEDATAIRAAEFIRTNRDKPFFLNYWQFSVHAPFEADPAWAAQYKKRADRIVAEGGPRYSHTYAAMIRKADRNIGRIINALKNNQVWSNTIIVWLSDNGGNTHSRLDGVHPSDNGPFRGGKGAILEGGVRVPMIVRWPGETAKGSVCTNLISCVDVFPTIAHMTKIPLRQSVDGRSFVPSLRRRYQDNAVYNYMPNQVGGSDSLPASASVTVRNIKFYCVFPEFPGDKCQYLMFDLNGDPQERHNLVDLFPGRASDMLAALNRWLVETRAALPRPNPAYRGL